jgi:hypothetical protein
MNQSLIIKNKNQTIFCQSQNKISSRKYSLNLNKFGAVVASTVGIFAGIMAGMSSY